MIDRFERFTLAIFEIARHWHKIAADEMARYGLKGPHALYLIMLSRHSEGVTAAKLCELCGKDKADVSRAVTAMESKGLIARDANQSKYRAALRLTAAGKTAAEFLSNLASKAVESGGSGLSEEIRNNLYEALTYIASNLRDLSKEGLPE